MGVILLRHTRPDVASGICYGRSDLGVAGGFGAEARRIAAQLPQVNRIVTSTLTRCATLAAWLAQARDLPLSTDPRLVELDFGRWEGLAWDAIPRAELDAWADDLLHARPHGGETVAEMQARTHEALRDHAQSGVLLVTHHGVIKCARELDMGADAWQSELRFGGWITLQPESAANAGA